MPDKKNQKKVNINGDSEEKEASVGISKSQRWAKEEKSSLGIKKKVSDLYKRDNLSTLQKPIKAKGASFIMVLLIALLFGIIGGGLGASYILSGNEIPSWIPFNIKTTSQENNTEDVDEGSVLIPDLEEEETDVSQNISLLKKSTWTIFKSKNNPEGFLDQIYAPWQSNALAVAVKKDGWLLTSLDFNEEDQYVAINYKNEIFNITRKIKDPKTGINLIKIPAQDIETSNILNYVNLNSGDDLTILDKFKNVWSTKVSDPRARNIYKTEDLVRSTDEFKNGIRINNGSILGRSPAGIVFKEKYIVGLVKDSSIIPAWVLAAKVDEAIKDKVFSWPLAGVEYLRVSETPGLLSDLFKDLKTGAIVYGDPAPDSSGEEAGLQNADVIISVDGIKVEPGMSLTYIFQSKNPGDQISLDFTREGEKLKTVIDLKEQVF